MRGIVLAVALLGMVDVLQAKEADTPRGEMRRAGPAACDQFRGGVSEQGREVRPD